MAWVTRPEQQRPTVDVGEASARNVMELFEWHDFEDPLGHKLTRNRDFLELVRRATGEPPDEPFPETGR